MMRVPRRLMVPFWVMGAVFWAQLALAADQSFQVPLTGSQTVPPVETSGKGVANITNDPATRMIRWRINYNGLSGPVTMAHFHGPAGKGENAGVRVWLTKQGSPAESPITGQATLTPEQAKDFSAGKWYVNLHRKEHPAGEIRGQVIPPKA